LRIDGEHSMGRLTKHYRWKAGDARRDCESEDGDKARLLRQLSGLI
jgi:hypothetical protein